MYVYRYDLALALHGLGWRCPQIARELGVLPRTARRWVRLLTGPTSGGIRYGDEWMAARERGEAGLYEACTRLAYKLIGKSEGEVEKLSGVQALDGLRKVAEVMQMLRGTGLGGDGAPSAAMPHPTGSIIRELSMKLQQRVLGPDGVPPLTTVGLEEARRAEFLDPAHPSRPLEGWAATPSTLIATTNPTPTPTPTHPTQTPTPASTGGGGGGGARYEINPALLHAPPAAAAPAATTPLTPVKVSSSAFAHGTPAGRPAEEDLPDGYDED